MTSHLRVSWFSSTGIDVKFSLKGILLTWFLAFFGHSTLPSLLSASTAKPGRPLLLSPSSILRWDQHQAATGLGSAQSLFQFSCMQRASSIHAHYGATVNSFMDSLIPAVRLPCPSAVFLGTIHETRKIFCIKIAPSLGNISPCTHPVKRSTASIMALSTWNVATSPHFMTKHSLCPCPRVE